MWVDGYACLFFLSFQSFIYDPIRSRIDITFDRHFTTSARVCFRGVHSSLSLKIDLPFLLSLSSNEILSRILYQRTPSVLNDFSIQMTALHAGRNLCSIEVCALFVRLSLFHRLVLHSFISSCSFHPAFVYTLLFWLVLVITEE